MVSSENKNLNLIPHNINLDCRKNLVVTAVKEIDSFDDHTVVACTSMGKLVVTGNSLNIKKLNLETGELDVTGKISSLSYVDGVANKSSGLFKKIFKR